MKASQTARLERVEAVRRQFGDLLRTKPGARERAGEEYQNYFQLCEDVRVENRRRETARREKARQVLKDGHFRERAPNSGEWTIEDVRGLISFDVLIAASIWSAPSCPIDAAERNPGFNDPIEHCCPIDGARLLASALVTAMEWEDKLERSRSEGEEAARECWAQWIAEHPSWSHEEVRLHVWFKPPPDTDQLPRPADRDIRELQELPKEIRLTLAWARLVRLWDLYTQDPISQDVPEEERSRLEEMIRRFDGEALDPPMTDTGKDGAATIDPEAVQVDLLEDCLRMVEQAMTRQPLSKRALVIYEKLLRLPPHQALTLPKLLEGLPSISDSVFNRDLKRELLPWGLCNKPKVGFYLKR